VCRCGDGEAAVRAKLISLSRRFERGKARAKGLVGASVARGARLAPVKSRKRRQRVITGACRQPQGEKSPSLAPLRPRTWASADYDITFAGAGPPICSSAEIGIDRRRRNRNALLAASSPSLSCLRSTRESVTHSPNCARQRRKGNIEHFGVGQAVVLAMVVVYR